MTVPAGRTKSSGGATNVEVEQKANEHVFDGGRRLTDRSVSSQRLARVWMVFFLARGEARRLLLGPSACCPVCLGGTLVGSLLRFLRFAAQTSV